MKRFEKLLAAIGLLGLVMGVLFLVFSLSSLAIIGFTVFFACVIGLIVIPAIGGYNPVEHGETKTRWTDNPHS